MDRSHLTPDTADQPDVRPIVCGKQDKPVEFGAKLSVSLTGEGLAHVDYMRWDVFMMAVAHTWKQRILTQRTQFNSVVWLVQNYG